MELEGKQFSDVIRWSNIYVHEKKSFEDYFDSCIQHLQSFESQLYPMLKRRNSTQLEIDYCSQKYLLDFSIIKDNNDFFVACGRMYKRESSVNIPVDQEIYNSVGDDIYIKNNYLFKKEEGIFNPVRNQSFSWLEDFISATLHHNFD